MCFFMFFFTAGQLSPVCPISLKSVVLVFDLSQHQWGSIPRDNLLVISSGHAV